LEDLTGGMKLILLEVMLVWKYEIDIIGGGATGGNMKLDIMEVELQEET
jgi:hypothetical protein